MLPPPDPAREAPRKLLVAMLAQAMQRDMEEQSDLLIARARGETDAVYWSERGGLGHWQEQTRICAGLTAQAILRTTLATRSVRQQIAFSKTLLASCPSGSAMIFAATRT